MSKKSKKNKRKQVQKQIRQYEAAQKTKQSVKREPVVRVNFIHTKFQWIRFILVAIALFGAYSFSLISSEKEQPFLLINLGLILIILTSLLFEMYYHKIIGIIMAVLIPICSFWILEGYSHVVFASKKGISWKIQILNIVFYALIYVFFMAITGHLGAAAIVTTLIWMVIALINYYTVSFRNTPILPWDLLSVKTAFSVTSQYSFKLPGRILMCSLLLVLLGCIGSKIQISIKKLIQRGIVCAGSLVLTFLMILMVQTDWAGKAFGLDDILFTPNVLYRNNGFVVAFTVNLKYLKVDKPANYKSTEVEEMATRYEEMADDITAVDEEQMPNVIVIMNEAFSDPAVVGDFTTNEDYMPFVHAMRRGEVADVVSGNLFVSVCGGNTANSEFEFLTGNTMAFLPPGSVVYQQYIHDTMPSMAWTLKNTAAYTTLGMHPYNASGWDRDEVYPFFGFDRTLFRDAMKNMSYFSDGHGYVRNYISDQAVTDLLIHEYESGLDSEKPQFLFAVTMQNHGGYFEDFDNFDVDINVTSVDEKSSHKIYLERYLSLIKKSDEALYNLVDYFGQTDDPTVIVFFGDHQPGDYVFKSFYDTKEVKPLQEAQKRYIVPFVIWANYDIQDEQVDQISLNYLQSLLFEKAGIPMTGYQKFLSDLREKLPVITANVMIDHEGHYYAAGDETPYDDLIDIYKSFQYNYLFDEKEKRTQLFGSSSS